MANLAILGHATRGKEVIETLEMLGGVNKFNLEGNTEYWYVLEGRVIRYCEILFEGKGFTLEEFLEKFPYKVGDKVKVKETGKDVTIEGMSWRNGREVIYDTCYNNDCVAFYSAEELQPYKEETMESKPNILQQLKEYFDNTPRDVIEKEWEELSHLNEIGPTVDEYLASVKKYRQANQYPNTYEACCDVLKIEYPYFKTEEDGISASTYKNKLVGALKQLLICRDAYWKIADEQMGLGKPWKPDWTNNYQKKWTINFYQGEINLTSGPNVHFILAFPTKEMRDAFYENFKDLIIECMELL